MVLIANFISN